MQKKSAINVMEKFEISDILRKQVDIYNLDKRSEKEEEKT